MNFKHGFRPKAKEGGWKSFLTNEREYDVGWKKLESFMCVFYLH